MASEFVLSIGDDNVVLIKIVNKKVANAWLASPDPATAQEELGEALAEDKKGRISIIVDTLDQAFKEEEIPKVGILDRRKVLSRHINMAFPGMNMRGARLVKETDKKTLLYEFASVPLDGRIPGWIDFYDSLPNQKGGVFAVAAENVDLVAALTPKPEGDAVAETEATQWRHFIGINVTGGLRQIIEKNGRLSLTRLTQAPPPDTPPDDFADMIVRDFKATITYLRRLGYSVGDPLDLVVLTSEPNKAALQALTWEGARSVSILTPHEAALTLGLGSIGPEDQAHCDVLHAAWFANKRRPVLPLTRSVAIGDAKDDIRELAFAASPYLAVLAAVGLTGWTGWTTYELIVANGQIEELDARLVQLRSRLAAGQDKVKTLPYEAATLRSLFAVEDALQAGKIDVIPPLENIFAALQGDAVILKIASVAPGAAPRNPGTPAPTGVSITISTRLADVVTKADEAARIANGLERRLADKFGKGYQVKMTREPVAAQASAALSGGLASSADLSGDSGPRDERFFADYQITGGGR